MSVNTATEENGLEKYGLKNLGQTFFNLSVSELYEHTIRSGEGVLSDSGALVIDTGKFTGRAPKDRYIVKDEYTKDKVHWGDVNIAVSSDVHDDLYRQVTNYFQGKDLYIKDCAAGVDENYRVNVRVMTEKPWSSLFVDNMFLRYNEEELKSFQEDWTVLCAPGFIANPVTDGVKRENFVIVDFTKKNVVIGGTGYTGEIKKSIFSVLNFILPVEHNVLPMHCSANVGAKGDTAIFFGLSGTGKTTLSSDPERKFIGDDEHAWTDKTVFNFEGGCYAKVIDIRQDTEPLIYNAIKFGALVENTNFFEGTRKINYHDTSKTLNTRVSYPIDFISTAILPSIGPKPKHIFFLTCDAFGILPPIAKLTKEQAMYHFIAGYTAKIAGTEEGIDEPEACFSACFGEPFLPLHPVDYAHLLGEKMEEQSVDIWLVNTGWTGGAYGVGHRMRLDHTRHLLSSAMNGLLSKVEYTTEKYFGLQIPLSCPGITENILNPEQAWSNKEEYDKVAKALVDQFHDHFKKYEDQTTDEILGAGPK